MDLMWTVVYFNLWVSYNVLQMVDTSHYVMLCDSCELTTLITLAIKHVITGTLSPFRLGFFASKTVISAKFLVKLLSNVKVYFVT